MRSPPADGRHAACGPASGRGAPRDPSRVRRTRDGGPPDQHAILAKATRYAVRKGSDCQKTRISFKLQHVQAPYTQSHMPKEAFYFGFRFRWLVGFDKHLQNTGREGREAFGLAKHLTNPADRSGSGQESRQPSQRCEQSINYTMKLKFIPRIASACFAHLWSCRMPLRFLDASCRNGPGLGRVSLAPGCGCERRLGTS